MSKMLLELLALFVAPAAAYGGMLKSQPLRAPFSPRMPISPFSGAGLVPHSTGLDAEQCPAEGLAPTHLEVAAPPRALPKRVGGDDEGENDPLGLWKPDTSPRGPGGPSIFKLNQGRAIDILRADYPALLTQKPDLSIFTENIELHDPSGRRLKGKAQYEKLFDALRFIRRTTMQDAQITYRLVVVDERIRVRWTAKLWMRDPALGLTTMANGEPAVVHLDGVSSYRLNDEGKIDRHVMENLVLRGPGEEVKPIQLQLAFPNLGLSPELAMPAPFFRPLDGPVGWAPPKGIAAWFESATGGEHAAASEAAQRSARAGAAHAAQPSRRRGGTPSMSERPAGESPMERAARERAEDDAKARSLAEMRAPTDDAPLSRLFSMPQPCDTSYDCERPDVCCDLLFGSVCCNGGLMIPTREGPPTTMQRQAIPIPVPVDDGPGRSLPPPPNPGTGLNF